MLNPDVNFLHIREHDQDGRPMNHGGGTAAFYKDGSVVHYAFALCSDRDNFSRKQGRLLAQCRLKSNDPDIQGTITIPDGSDDKWVYAEVRRRLFNRKLHSLILRSYT